ncbi:Soluble quinoprotein glucose/sorbosone dehydrogenase [Cordyceps fumosorosea ARSEF 2679]|uniref:Soluble quinoprotein glucose/sorbosone dehydrogenase n=1 Tax=Cordyceps fumosorosea (strain ARSEF 2679) TaxID=1081104 RepID=A0A167UCZ9_CORFA|nr:Soluble quinoprotein glucose/sorbosone dehydrogenase [Cordyceps fumosorosea ARSEF 2679]OAA61462.1 Soluble quinoprotein glucose/sorbosone dehydrogenase [Cordyceps fumosorosea ARSEF 2679]
MPVMMVRGAPAKPAADGVTCNVLTNQVAQPRQLVQDRLGNVLMAEQRGIRRLELDDAEGMDLISLTADGKTLFASSSTDVYAFPYDAEMHEGAILVLVQGMSQPPPSPPLRRWPKRER